MSNVFENILMMSVLAVLISVLIISAIPKRFFNKHKRKIVIFFILLSIGAEFYVKTRSIFGVIHTDGPYSGHIVEAKTGKPIEGAVVAGLWNVEQFAIFNYFLAFGNAAETVTDNKGSFFLPRIWVFTSWPFSWLESPEIVVFKGGYDTHPPIIHEFWDKEDIDRRGISKGAYGAEYYVQCKPDQECLIRLNMTETDRERRNALNGVRKGKIHDSKDLRKVRKYLSEANKDLAMYGFDQREFD